MNAPRQATPPLPDSTVAAAGSRAPSTRGWLPERTGSEVADFEGWLGYESIHPLTWVPDARAVNGGMVAD